MSLEIVLPTIAGGLIRVGHVRQACAESLVAAGGAVMWVSSARWAMVAHVVAPGLTRRCLPPAWTEPKRSLHKCDDTGAEHLPTEYVLYHLSVPDLRP